MTGAPLSCRLVHWQLTREREGLAAWLPSGWTTRHLAGCARCVELAATLAELEPLVRAGSEAVRPPSALRGRVLAAYERDRAESRAAPEGARSGRLLWATWGVGAIACLTLVLAIFISRIDDFRPAPRSVRIAIPAGYTLAAEPAIRIRRASGRVEQR